MAAETLQPDDLSPAERRRRKVRDSILEAAETLFAQEGEAGISMRRIAERIDYSPAALYKYFDSKEALFEEIREQFFARLIRKLEAASGEGPFVGVARACLRAYLETGLEEPNHYRMAFTSWCEAEPVAEDSYGFQAASMLTGMLAEGVEQGAFRADLDPLISGKSVWASLHGLTMLLVTLDDFPQAMPGSEHVTRDQVVEGHLDMILRSLTA